MSTQLSENEILRQGRIRADGFLVSCTDMSLREQLTMQMILQIKQVRTIRRVLGYLNVYPERNGIVMTINIDQEAPDKLNTIGHELAHTFEMSEGGQFIVEAISQGRRFVAEQEAYCDKFAERWLKLGTVKIELELLLDDSYGRMTIYSE